MDIITGCNSTHIFGRDRHGSLIRFDLQSYTIINYKNNEDILNLTLAKNVSFDTLYKEYYGLKLLNESDFLGRELFF